MAEDVALVTDQKNVPNFGHLAAELRIQKMYDVLHLLLRKGEITSYNYCTIAEKFAQERDPETFEILISQTQRGMTNVVKYSGEDIGAYSAYCLGYYFADENHREAGQAQLIKILLHHGQPCVRAFAAEALGRGAGPAVTAALEKAKNDNGQVMTSQGHYDYVYQYAEEALKKVVKSP